jgi:phosphatidate cytidylyltransferase
MVAVFAVSVHEWSRLSVRSGRIHWGLLGAGVVYLAIACLCAAWLRTDESWGFYLVLYVFLAVWACDIGAYTAGKIIGGPKMAPKVSPNKTWAGLVGGCVAAVAAVMLYDLWLGMRADSPVIEHFSLFFQLTLGLLLAVVGQLGDLMISVLKRKCGLKDTGNIIPGHGGLLDRIDALLLTIPVYTASIVYLEYLLS